MGNYYPTPPREIHLRLDRMDVFVHRRDIPTVEPLLSQTAITFASGPGGILGRRQSLSLLRREPNGEGRFAAKLIAFVDQGLGESGHRPSVTIAAGQRWIAPDERTIAKMSGPASQLLANRFAQMGSLIRFRGAAHPFAVVPDLLRAFPWTRAAVAVRNRDHVRGWVRCLERAGLGRPVLTQTTWRGGSHPLVHVSSLRVLECCTPFDFDLVIIPDARPMLGIDARPIDYDDPHPPRDYRLLRHWHIPAFGFLPVDHRLLPGEERRMWSLFARTTVLGY